METIRIALTALRANKLRSFLTLLGVIIGVTTIVSVVSVISGLNNYVGERVLQLNPDVFIITKFGLITNRQDFLAALRRKNIDMNDVRAVQQRCANCGAIGSGIESSQTVKRLSKHLSSVDIYGCTANLVQLYNIEVEAGRFFNLSEEQHSAAVAVIGSDVRDELFGQLDPVGRDITLGGKRLRVIGLLKKQGSVLGQSQDKVLYFPLGQFRSIYGGRHSVDIFIRPTEGLAKLQQTEDEVRTILRSRRHTSFGGTDPFGILTAEAVQALWSQISASSFAFMVFISGISLIVGGIVITNIMLVSVVERTREIGVRMAMGARKRDILRQFLTEAVLLSGFGGLIGIAIGWGISKIISTASPLPTLVRPSLLLAGIMVAVVTGLIAGIAPAWRASRLPPVEALRYE